MLIRGGVAILAAGMALGSCCLRVDGLEENAGASNGGVLGSGPSDACHRGVDMQAPVTTLGGDGGAFWGGRGVAVDPSGNVYVSTEYAPVIDRIDCADEISSLSDQTFGAAGIAVDRVGDVYVADSQFSMIRKVDPNGNVTVVVGGGPSGWADGSGGPDGSAELNHPGGVALDPGGNLFVADSLNNRIRKIDMQGNVTTVAGDGDAGFVDGTGGPSGSAQFDIPTGVAVDGSGNVYVADTSNFSIRKVDRDGNVTTLAGHPPSSPSSVDGTGGPQGTARFVSVGGIAVDPSGSVLVVDSGANRIRRIDTSGNVTTLAGNGRYGNSDGTLGPSGTAEFSGPIGIGVDASGNIYVNDFGTGRLRMITP